MQHNHKTLAGKILHSIFSIFTHAKVHVEDGKIIITGAGLDKIWKVFLEVEDETKNVTDPAEKVKAICQYVLNHMHELPNDVDAAAIIQYVTHLCSTTVDLPLSEIEGIVKVILGSRQN